jgi:hypothetical protein
VAVTRKPGHHHNRDEMTDMEAVGRGVEAPVQRQRRLEPLPQHLFFGALIDKATILEGVKEGLHVGILAFTFEFQRFSHHLTRDQNAWETV